MLCIQRECLCCAYIPLQAEKISRKRGTIIHENIFDRTRHRPGCTHHCKGCFNAETWDFHYGQQITQEVEEKLLALLEPEFIAGLTVLGGEPFEPENQRVLLPFLKKVKQEYPHKTIWCYTGYLLDEQLWKNSPARCEVTDEMLLFLDILVVKYQEVIL